MGPRLKNRGLYSQTLQRSRPALQVLGPLGQLLLSVLNLLPTSNTCVRPRTCACTVHTRFFSVFGPLSFPCQKCNAPEQSWHDVPHPIFLGRPVGTCTKL